MSGNHDNPDSYGLIPAVDPFTGEPIITRAQMDAIVKELTEKQEKNEGARKWSALLSVYRKRAHLSQKELGEKLGVSYGNVGAWEKEGQAILPERLGNIVQILSLSPAEAEHFIVSAHPDIIQNVDSNWLRTKIKERNWEHINYPALDAVWLNAYPETKQAGLLFTAYRKRAGISQQKVEAFIKGAIDEWVSGKLPIPIGKIEPIATLFALTDEEAERLAILAQPNLIKILGEDRLKTGIAARDWQNIQFPALDDTWLSNQPDSKRAGLLLAAYRTRKGMSQGELASAMGMTQGAIGWWELGKNPISLMCIETLVEALSLTDNEAEHFILQVKPAINPSGNKDWLRSRIIERDWECIRFPALHPSWLAAQASWMRAGLLLATYRTRLGMDSNELGRLMGVSKQQSNQWEKRHDPIPHARLEKLVHILSLSDEEAEYFISVVSPHIIQNIGQDWLKAKIAAKNWDAINNPALESNWLMAQPSHKRAGLLLDGYCLRSGLTVRQLGDAIGTSNVLINQWKLGRANIPAARIDAIAGALSLTSDEKDYFTSTVALSRQARKEVRYSDVISADSDFTEKTSFSEKSGRKHSLRPESAHLERNSDARGK